MGDGHSVLTLRYSYRRSKGAKMSDAQCPAPMCPDAPAAAAIAAYAPASLSPVDHPESHGDRFMWLRCPAT